MSIFSNITNFLGKGTNYAQNWMNQITGGAYYDIVGRTDRTMAEEQWKASEAFAHEQFEYSKMQDQRNFHESLPTTKMARLAEAGLHPTLAVGGASAGAGSSVPVQGSHPQPQARPHALDAMMKAASIASMIAGVGKIKAETADIAMGTQLKGVQISSIEEGIRLSQLDQQVLKRRMENGDLSNRHMLMVTEKLYEDIEHQMVSRNLTEAKTENLIAMSKLEHARISHNTEVLKRMGLHEHSLMTEAGGIAAALEDIMRNGIFANKSAKDRVTRWFEEDRKSYESRMEALRQRIERRRK